jgi:hypothetical protein
MPHDNRQIIADGPRSAPRYLILAVLLGALVAGSVAAVHYAQAGLTLSHYDARAHLVVSRRIVDSLTPGWKQIGAVWLPLPHLLNMPVVQWDWAYRTGFPSTAISVAAVAAGLACLSAFLFRHTQSTAVAAMTPLVLLLNPNVLFLQSTPMTEPLLIGLSLASLFLVDEWAARGDRSSLTRAGGAILALALTRYEGWFVAAALVAGGAWARRGHGTRDALRLVPFLAAAVIGFLLLSKASTGLWFVSSGFFEVDVALLHRPLVVLRHIVDGTWALSGPLLLASGVAGAALAIVLCIRGQSRVLLLLALAAAAALPAYAFYQGHPFRIRYMVPIVVACAALAFLPVAQLPRRLQWPAAAALTALILAQSPPLDADAPMVVEAQWETPHRRGREVVTQYLEAYWDGTPILASMGSLGHFMQESSSAGLGIADYVHEGNGGLWAAASRTPARYVRWMLIEERAEGGDLFAARARDDDQYLEGLERVAEGGGVVLYRRGGTDINLR